MAFIIAIDCIHSSNPYYLNICFILLCGLHLKLPSAILFILSIAATIITAHAKSCCKLNLSRLSVCKCSARSNGVSVTFFFSHGTLYHAAFYQNRDAVFIWSVEK